MPKTRVHELAKQLGINSKEIVEYSKKIGVDASSHMSALNDNEKEAVLKHFDGNKTGAASVAARSEEKRTPEAVREHNIDKREDSVRTERPVALSEGERMAPRSAPRNEDRQRSGEPRLRPDGSPRPMRPRPEGGQRPAGQRPDGGQRPMRPRPDGSGRPAEQRPDGSRPPMGQRPDGSARPMEQRPDGSWRPVRPRPEGGQRPMGQRPDGGQRQGGQRPDGSQQRPMGQRPDGSQPRQGGPRPEGSQQRPYTPRQAPRQYTGPVSDIKQVERPQRPEGSRPPYQGGQGGGQRPPYQGGQGGGQRPPYQGGQGGGQRPPYQGGQGGGQRAPYQGGGYNKDGGGYNKDKDSGYNQRPGQGKPGQNRPAQGRQGQGGAGGTKLQQLTKPDSRAPRNENYKKNKGDKTSKLREQDTLKTSFKANTKQRSMPPKEEKIEITTASIPQNITVKNFAEVIGKNTSVVIKTLMKSGIMANLNQEIDFEVAQKIGEQLNVLIDLEEEKDLLDEMFKEDPDDTASLVERPPVVVVMGHVDHGKTSLLDAIRESSVQVSEAGGITQHIGAYTTQINDRSITFLDTPGHEAFTAMRMRGASITDIAILVVAADDGVMPQTIEAINHAKAAGVEIIVAINKIDKPSGNPDRVKQELTEHGLLVEEWGGDTVCVPVSALKRTGLDKLQEMILLVADIKELKANPNKRAKGTVVEALLDKGRGPVATVLIQEGTLRIGDSIVAGSCYGKVRAMIDDKGKRVKKAGPSKPVEILGLSEAPKAGDTLYSAENDKQARQITETLIAKDRVDMTRASVQKVSLEDLFDQIKAGNVKDLNIVIKADVQGSVEAVKQSLERLSNEEVKIRTIHGGVGAVTESDVMLAAASNAIIIGFNVRPEATAKSVADVQKVDIRLYRVIYNAIEDINSAIKGMLDPIYREKVIGHAEIRQVFKASGVGTIGGSYVLDGKFVRNGKVRIVRDGVVVYEGELESLKRFKDDVKEVAAGYECGLLFNKFNDIREGDVVEAYVMEEIER